MKTYALTYWFTWAFLVIAAALTGVASLKQAFFGGLFASGLSALLTGMYVRAGARYAPLLGATAGRTTLAGEGLQHQPGLFGIEAARVPGHGVSGAPRPPPTTPIPASG